MRKICAMICILFSGFFSLPTQALELDTNSKFAGAIRVLKLSGTHQEMGFEYGRKLRQELLAELNILKDFYIKKHAVSYDKLAAQANLFYERFPYSYQIFIQAMAQGAEISLDDAKILNAMETLGRLVNADLVGSCAYISLPENKTTTRAALIGRNYDFPAPYNQMANYLTVTVLQEANAIPTAFISFPGQIYCPSCINAHGIFMEMNNGTPSGGRYLEQDRQTLLINMLQALQNSANATQLHKQLSSIQSDYSLIVNTNYAGKTNTYEYSSTLGLKSLAAGNADIVTSTNFYLNKNWRGIPEATDTNTWKGVTRRNNLLTLAQQSEQFDMKKFQMLMDKTLKEGGAAWEYTIYQLIYDAHDETLYLKINAQGNAWNKVPLHELLH